MCTKNTKWKAFSEEEHGHRYFWRSRTLHSSRGVSFIRLVLMCITEKYSSCKTDLIKRHNRVRRKEFVSADLLWSLSWPNSIYQWFVSVLIHVMFSSEESVWERRSLWRALKLAPHLKTLKWYFFHFLLAFFRSSLRRRLSTVRRSNTPSVSPQDQRSHPLLMSCPEAAFKSVTFLHLPSAFHYNIMAVAFIFMMDNDNVCFVGLFLR